MHMCGDNECRRKCVLCRKFRCSDVCKFYKPRECEKLNKPRCFSGQKHRSAPQSSIQTEKKTLPALKTGVFEKAGAIKNFWNIVKMVKYVHVFIIVIPTVLIKKVPLKRIMNT